MGDNVAEFVQCPYCSGSMVWSDVYVTWICEGCGYESAADQKDKVCVKSSKVDPGGVNDT